MREALEVFYELGGGDAVGLIERYGAGGPYGGDPGKVGADVPLVGEIEPLAGTDGGFDLFARFEGKECGGRR